MIKKMELKELLPYIIVAVAMVCITSLAYSGSLPIEEFKQFFLLLIGWVTGGAATNLALRYKLKKLQN